MIAWNPHVKLILSDVDETIADLYLEAEPAMIAELTKLLEENHILFFITGQSVKSILWRITDLLPHYVRKNILVGHCSGAEVFGFGDGGEINTSLYYSVYESQLNTLQKKKWRIIMKALIKEFGLQVYPTMPLKEFSKQVGNNPLAIMYEDRGPQITMEFVNGYDVSQSQVAVLPINVSKGPHGYDLRLPILASAVAMFQKANLPITPRVAGVFALDFALQGVSKTTAIHQTLNDYKVLGSVGLRKEDVDNAEAIEIWGDKFSVARGGTDRHMCEAVSPLVRSISFREEDPHEFPLGYNIQVWDGDNRLHHGLLEYLRKRHL